MDPFTEASQIDKKPNRINNVLLWYRQIDGAWEGRTLGIGLTFVLRKESNGLWNITALGNGKEISQDFSEENQAKLWAEKLCVID